MSAEEVSDLKSDLARLAERIEGMNDRLKRIEQLIFVSGGGVVVGLLYAVLTHQLHLP